MRLGVIARQLSVSTTAATEEVLNFSGSFDVSKLPKSPLDALRKRSEAKGLCDAIGNRKKGAPWGFQLAHTSSHSPWPVIRTIGFQTVTADYFTFLMKRRPEGVPSSGLPIAITYVEGKYQAGDITEQWRAEGLAEEIPVGDVLTTAPMSSFAQIMVAAGWKSGDSTADTSSRSILADRHEFVRLTDDAKSKLNAGQVPADSLASSVVVYKVRPIRGELLIGGPDFPMWERIEWRRQCADSEWEGPTRILPY